MCKKIYTPVFVAFLCALLFMLFPVKGITQKKEWKVWVRTSPCSGRHDWITVAKSNPTGGLNFFYQANEIFPGTSCTLTGCTLAEANAVAATLRNSPEFHRYCCRDYSVWQHTKTGKMSIVLGKFATAGVGWVKIKADLCCEEAEDFSGLIGACSGRVKKTEKPVVCYPGSIPKYNAQTKRTECFCKPGLVWNATHTACVKPEELVKQTDCSVFGGSYAAWNEQTQRVECFCPPGKIWNAGKTACIDDPSKINCYPGSYAAFNSQTNRTECFCNPGLVWNANRTACIKPEELAKQTDCSSLSGSYAAWNEQTQRVECFCPPGKIWNAAKTACIDEPSKINCYPGSYAAFNPQTNRTECFCNAGLVWNATKTACVKPTTVTGTKTWKLIATECYPERKTNWTFGAGNAHVDVYNGDKASFQWTPPPAQFDNNGFTVTVSAQAQLGPNSKVTTALIGASGGGAVTILNKSDERSAYASIPDGQASVSRAIVFKPSGSGSDEIKVIISVMWGEYTCTYKYKLQ